MKNGVPAWSVVIVLTNANNHMLALSRGFNVHDPAFPGGDSEPEDVSPARTVLRELQEETGLIAGEARLIDRWEGERGQPVFAFYVPKWRGRLRASPEGKPYWTRPEKLLTKNATYQEEARRILAKLSETLPAAKTA